jgi:hypothetical protein
MGDCCRVASIEMLRLPQLDARVSRIVNHLMSDSDCEIDPPITTRRSARKGALGVHASLDLVRGFSNP